MGTLGREREPARPTFSARPVERKISAEELSKRVMERFPKVMARLAE